MTRGDATRVPRHVVRPGVAGHSDERHLSVMADSPFHLIGAGVYSLPEAERLTGVPRKRLRRWMEGYHFRSSGTVHHSPPVIEGALGRSAGELALTFSDLIEVRFLDRFLECGVSWRAIRIAAERAREYLGRPHPFSTKIFKTDGHAILLEIVRAGDDASLLNLVANQWELQRIVSPLLYAGLEFNEMLEPQRWWPMGERKRVVVDPERAFGAPIDCESGVPTQVLNRSFAAERSFKMVAAIYDVPLKAVRHAVEFERAHAA